MAINFKEFNNKLKNTECRSKAKLVESAIQPSALREEFFSQELFGIGRSVSINNVLHEIIDKRSNYVVAINESGDTVRKFPADLIPSNQKVNFNPGTYKGAQIPTGFELVVEQQNVKDPYGFIKCLGHIKQRRFDLVIEAAEEIGIDMQSLSEATKQDQLQAISIVSTALDITLTGTEPQKQVDELVKKASAKSMFPDQKKIYSDMMGMLKRLGLKIQSNIKEDEFTPTLQKKKQLAIDKTEIGHSLHADDTARKLRVRKLMGL